MVSFNKKDQEEVKVIFEEMIARLDYSKDRKRKENYSAEMLWLIEQFCVLILNDARLPFFISDDESGMPSVGYNETGKMFMDIKTYRRNGYSDYSLSVYANVYFEAVEEFQDLDMIIFHESLVINKRTVKLANDFCVFLRGKLKNQKVKKGINIRNSRVNKLYRDTCDYESKIFDKYQDIVAVSIELAGGGNVMGWMALKGFKEKFLKNGSHRQPLSWLVGYIGKWEFERTKGFYASFILLFDARKVIARDALLHEVGQYWFEDITSKTGDYYEGQPFLSIKNKKIIDNGFVFTIRRDDESGRASLKRSILYLTKSSKYLNSVLLSGNRNFYKGHIKGDSDES